MSDVVGILGVDVVVDPPGGGRGRVGGVGDQVNGLAGVDLVGREGREAGLRSDGRGPPVRGDVDGAHPLRDLVGEGPSRLDQLVELEVQVAEVLADDVPVRLLALQMQVDQVDMQLLQVISELLGRLEGRVGDVLGDSSDEVCRS